MFLDAVWAHLGMFVVGQVFAWRYARSGRFWLGAGATALLWLALDAWLVSRARPQALPTIFCARVKPLPVSAGAEGRMNRSEGLIYLLLQIH